MEPPAPSIEAHFHRCVTTAFTRAHRFGEKGGHAADTSSTLLRDLQTPERWLRAIERVRAAFYTRRSVDQITQHHRKAWSAALDGDGVLTTHSFLRGDTLNPLLVDSVTQALAERAIGSLVLTTTTIPWKDRLTWSLRTSTQADIRDQAWRYWRYGEIVRWLTDPVTSITEGETSISLLIGVVLTHFAEDFASGTGAETATHWLALLDTLGDGIMPIAYSSRARTLTLARWRDLEGASLPS